MPLPKIKIPFNPEHMTARDLMQCAETLKMILKAYQSEQEGLVHNALWHADKAYSVEETGGN